MVLLPEVTSIVRSLTASVSSKALYSASRDEVSTGIQEQLSKKLLARGIEIEEAMLRKVVLPVSAGCFDPMWFGKGGAGLAGKVVLPVNAGCLTPCRHKHAQISRGTHTTHGYMCICAQTNTTRGCRHCTFRRAFPWEVVPSPATHTN